MRGVSGTEAGIGKVELLGATVGKRLVEVVVSFNIVWSM